MHAAIDKARGETRRQHAHRPGIVRGNELGAAQAQISRHTIEVGAIKMHGDGPVTTGGHSRGVQREQPQAQLAHNVSAARLQRVIAQQHRDQIGHDFEHAGERLVVELGRQRNRCPIGRFSQCRAKAHQQSAIAQRDDGRRRECFDDGRASHEAASWAQHAAIPVGPARVSQSGP